MNYLERIINAIQFLIKSNLYLLILSFILILVLIFILYYKYDYFNYKIKNIYRTLFLCWFYLIFYIGIIFCFRVFRKTINFFEMYSFLLQSQQEFLNYSLFKKWLISFICIICICIWLLIFIKLYKICIQAWIKIHLYLYFKYMEKYQKIINFFIYNFSVQGSLTQLNLKLLTPWQIKFYLKYPNNILNDYSSKIIIFLKWVLKNIHWIILFIVIYYDIFFNNYILILTTKYLPIFMIFLLWHQISNFFQKQNPSFNKILAEQWYSKNVVYINLSEQEEQILLNYTKTFKFLDMASFENDANYLNPIIQLHRFVQIEDKIGKKYYYNEHIQLGFDPKDLIIINSKYVVNVSCLRHMIFNVVDLNDEY